MKAELWIKQKRNQGLSFDEIGNLLIDKYNFSYDETDKLIKQVASEEENKIQEPVAVQPPIVPLPQAQPIQQKPMRSIFVALRVPVDLYEHIKTGNISKNIISALRKVYPQPIQQAKPTP